VYFLITHKNTVGIDFINSRSGRIFYSIPFSIALISKGPDPL
jgi:hypothetical protein